MYKRACCKIVQQALKLCKSLRPADVGAIHESPAGDESSPLRILLACFLILQQTLFTLSMSIRVIFNILDHRGLFAVGKDVMGKGDQHKHTVYEGNCGDHLWINGGEHHHKDETEEKDRGADLAADQCADEHLSFTELNDTGDQLKAFFQYK